MKLVVTFCSLSLLSIFSSDAYAASEIESAPLLIHADCPEEPAKRRLSPSNLSTERKFEILAEKLDYLTACADELSCNCSPINSESQRYLQSALTGFFASADFLYWQADEDKLEYAINFQGGFGNSQVVNDKLAGLNFDWNPGFRVTIGGTSCDCDHWGVYLNYTQIRNKAHGNINLGQPSATNLIFPTWDQIFLGVVTSGGHARWHVDYSTEHLEAYKDYFVGRHLIFRPHMGLLNANINQEYHVNYDLLPNISVNVPQSKMRAKCNYWGLGVGGGTDVLWHFTPHFGIYGEFSAGILYGKFDVHRNGTSVIPTDTNVGNPFSFHFKKEMWRTRATMQTALGLEWETVFNRDRNRIAISLGYEFNAWFQQNQFMTSLHDADNNIAGIKNAPTVTYKFADADLAFKGGTLRATINF